MDIIVSMHQNQGKREYQQDAMSIKKFPSIGVLSILADGMGGYEGGEIASKLVSENFRDFTIDGDIGESLKKYLLKGNAAIKEYKADHPNVKSMGTTAIAFFMTDKSCQWVSVGDSPLYVIRNRNSIKRINENHSLAGLLDLQAAKGEISQEEALSSGQRHMLTSAVSGDDIPQIEVSTLWSVKENDIFILASDGIETISEDRIKELVIGFTTSGITQENVQKACEALVQDVMDQGTKNQDNVTVIILAKMTNGEPKTAIYTGESLDFEEKKKLPLSVIAGIMASVLVIILTWFLLSREEVEKIPVSYANKAIESAKAKAPTEVKIESNVITPVVTHKAIDNNKNPAVVKTETNAMVDSNKTIDKSKTQKKENKQVEESNGKIKVTTPTKEQIEQAKQDEAG